MEHVDLSTPNILDENVEKLAELFPEVVTEVREPDGTLRHTIDVDALKECVGDVAEGQRERYQFTWPGKREAKQEAYRQIDKCLRPCPEESVDWDTTGNLYIEGDNLDALKLLRNTYAGKVKMIYIDPPYNTGHDFIYDDDFSRSKADYDADSGDYDEEGGRLVVNPESNGRFHSDWCSMMYPRLLLARDLLSEDGIIFISISDAERENVSKICDEIFGVQNYVSMFVWQKGKEGGNDSALMRSHYDNILCYCRNCSASGIINLDEKDTSRHITHDKEKNLVAGIESLENEGEPFQLINLSKQKDYTVRIPLVSGEVLKWPSYAPQTTIDRWIKVGKVFVGSKKVPYIKSYLKDEAAGQRPSNIIGQEHGTSKAGSIEIRSLFGSKDIFPYPKPSALLKRLLVIGSSNNGLVLDFFSGSATTAHAVMKLNAEDGGNRKFIMVQLPEACDEKSEAAKAGYKNICEIGKERIRRAGKKIVAEIEKSNRQLKLGEEPERVPDVGFRVLKIDSSNFRDVSAQPSEFIQDKLMGMADNLKPDRSAEDLLFQVMPQFQIPLSASIEKFDVQGFRVFSVDGGRLISCFDGGITTDAIAAMAKLEPDYAVMRDASFIGDDAVANFGELFKTYSPVTITKVI